MLNESVSANDRRVNDQDGAAAAGLWRGCEHFLDLNLLQLYLQAEECT